MRAGVSSLWGNEIEAAGRETDDVGATRFAPAVKGREQECDGT
jgi:hypothetical protein